MGPGLWLGNSRGLEKAELCSGQDAAGSGGDSMTKHLNKSPLQGGRPDQTKAIAGRELAVTVTCISLDAGMLAILWP